MIPISSIFNGNVTVRKPRRGKKEPGSRSLNQSPGEGEDCHVNPKIYCLFDKGLDRDDVNPPTSNFQTLREVATLAGVDK